LERGRNFFGKEGIEAVLRTPFEQRGRKPQGKRHGSFCGWKDRAKAAAELRAIYRAETAEVAAIRLAEFEAGRGARSSR
jgi:hypothetical protein